MKKQRYLAAFSAIFFSLSFGLQFAAQAQPVNITQCNASLQRTFVERAAANLDQQSLHYAMCNMTFEEFSNSAGGSAEASYKLIGGSGSYNQSNYSKFRNESCSSSSQSSFNQSFSHYASSRVPAVAFEAWKSCVAAIAGQKKEMACYTGAESTTDQVVVHIERPVGSPAWRPAGLSVKNGKILLGPSENLSDSSKPVAFGRHTVIIERESRGPSFLGAYAPVDLSIQWAADGQSQICRVFVPGNIFESQDTNRIGDGVNWHRSAVCPSHPGSELEPEKFPSSYISGKCDCGIHTLNALRTSSYGSGTKGSNCQCQGPPSSHIVATSNCAFMR